MKTIKHVFQIQPKVASFEVPSCSAHGAQSAILSGPTAADQSMSVLFAIPLLGNGALFRMIVVDHICLFIRLPFPERKDVNCISKSCFWMTCSACQRWHELQHESHQHYLNFFYRRRRDI